MSDYYIVFWQGSHTNKDMVHGDPANAQPGDIWLPFIATNDDRIVQHYDYTGSAGNYQLIYSPPVQPTVIQRELFSFIQALRTEPTFDAHMRMNLAGLMALVQANYQMPTEMQKDWNDAVAVYGATWLTSAVQTTILNYAKQYNIPLTTSIP